MRKSLLVGVVLAAVLTGCSNKAAVSSTPTPLPIAASSTSVPAPSSVAPSDIAPACEAFKAAIEATPSATRGKLDGEFGDALADSANGGKVNGFGYAIWLDLYSGPYLPASASSAIRTPIESFGKLADEVTADNTETSSNLPSASQSKSITAAYKDARDQCKAAGSPLH